MGLRTDIGSLKRFCVNNRHMEVAKRSLFQVGPVEPGGSIAALSTAAATGTLTRTGKA
jgi:hypothetical protein